MLAKSAADQQSTSRMMSEAASGGCAKGNSHIASAEDDHQRDFDDVLMNAPRTPAETAPRIFGGEEWVANDVSPCFSPARLVKEPIPANRAALLRHIEDENKTQRRRRTLRRLAYKIMMVVFVAAAVYFSLFFLWMLYQGAREKMLDRQQQLAGMAPGSPPFKEGAAPPLQAILDEHAVAASDHPPILMTPKKLPAQAHVAPPNSTEAMPVGTARRQKELPLEGGAQPPLRKGLGRTLASSGVERAPPSHTSTRAISGFPVPPLPASRKARKHGDRWRRAHQT